MKRNYHSHTTWCNHARYTAESVVKMAIEEGFETWGFSEHIYSPTGHNPMSLENKSNYNAYVEEILALKQKYAGKIEILIGLEMEIIDPFMLKVPVDFINEIASDKRIDFMLAGYHSHPDGTSVYNNKPTKKHLQQNIKNWEILFTQTPIRYVAHPCAFVEGAGKWEDWMEPYVVKMAELAKKHDVILGININGIHKQRQYPCPEFWKIVGQVGTKSILELDSHSSGPFNKKHIEMAKDMAKKYNVNLVDKSVMLNEK